MDPILGTATTRLGAPNITSKSILYKYSGLHPITTRHEEERYEEVGGYIWMKVIQKKTGCKRKFKRFFLSTKSKCNYYHLEGMEGLQAGLTR